MSHAKHEDAWRSFSQRSLRRCRLDVSLGNTLFYWNAELISGGLVEAVRAVKERPGRGIPLRGVALLAMHAGHGLTDGYTFVVHPVIAGRGPLLLEAVDLKLDLIKRREFRSGALAQRYRPVA